MATLNRRILSVCLVLALALTSLTGCGGDDPKSLAKQQFEVFAEAMKMVGDGKDSKDPKAVKLKEKSEAVDAKVKALSAEDKKIYDEEMKRLLKEGK